MSDELFAAMKQSIIDGDEDAAAAVARQALAAGIDPLEAINRGYVAGMSYVGDQFSAGEMFLPDMMLAAEAMKAAIAVLEPEKRPVGAVADHNEVNNVAAVEVAMDLSVSLPMLHDPGHGLEERILNEQFGY